MDEQKREITIAVGSRIRYFRHLRSISQEEVALQANLNPAYFGQVERGLKCPTVDTLYKIAKALDVSPAELLYTPKGSVSTSYQGQRITELLSHVPADKMDQVMRIMEDVAGLFSK